MEIVVKRIAKKPTYTIGKLYINNKYFCDTIEDKDRGLTSEMPLSKIRSIKVPSETAIPTGTYKITLDIISPRLSKKQFYRDYANGGRVPRLLNIKGFDGVLIHVGNTALDSSGCLIVGENKRVGEVINSRETFKKLYKELLKDKNNITLKIY